jgi:predicted phage-related endonuclease
MSTTTTPLNDHCEVLIFDPDKPRPLGINAFDASAMMGANNHKGQLEVWAEKIGKIPYDGPKASKARRDLKRTVAQMYAEERNKVVVYWPRTVRSTVFDFMQYRTDYFVCDRPDLQSGIVHDNSEVFDSPANIVSLLDVRAVGIMNPASTAGWDDDEIPMKYEAQGMHAFAVTGISRVTYAVLLANEGLRVRTRVYDGDDIQTLIETEFGFWENVETKTEPPVDASESTFRALKKMYPVQVEGKSVTLEGAQADTYRQWANAKDMSDTAEKLATLLRAQLELIVGDAESIIVDGKVMLTYKKAKDGSKFDLDAFKEAHPEFIDEFTVPTTGSRRWTPKK